MKTSTLDINFLINKFGNALYFTIITFTTVGYGDIMPLNWMKLVVSLESFLGVFFTASFVVTRDSVNNSHPNVKNNLKLIYKVIFTLNN